MNDAVKSAVSDALVQDIMWRISNVHDLRDQELRATIERQVRGAITDHAALAAQGQPAAVKALDWEPRGVANFFGLQYGVSKYDGDWLARIETRGLGRFWTEDEAKAACQADCAARVSEWAINAPAQPATDDIADAVLSWMVKHDLLDAGNEYRASDVLAVLDDLAPAQMVSVIQPRETAPSGPSAMSPSQVDVHEGAWAWVIGTNGKRAGWVDTHAMFAHQLYRHHILVDAAAPAQPVSVPEGDYIVPPQEEPGIDAMRVIDPGQWEPCSPEWLERGGDCAHAPRVWNQRDKNHWHPKITAAPQPPAEGGRAFQRGERVRKTKGSSWQGRVVGFYSTDLTPIGYAVESERELGSVQIYPESALEPAPANGGDTHG